MGSFADDTLNWFRQRTTATRRLEDGLGPKKFPNSIRALVRSIRKHWAFPDNEERPSEGFSIVFMPTYKEIAGHYPGNKIKFQDKNGKELKDISHIINSIEHGDKDVSFFQLRAFAHYVGIPTGLFLLYSQALGDATRRRDSPDDVINLIEASIDGLIRLRKEIGNRSSLEGFMYDAIQESDYGLEYVARLDPLEHLLESYGSKRKAPGGSR